MFEMSVTSPAEVGRAQLGDEFALSCSFLKTGAAQGCLAQEWVCWDTPECGMIITGVGQTEKEKL